MRTKSLETINSIMHGPRDTTELSLCATINYSSSEFSGIQYSAGSFPLLVGGCI